MLNIIDWLILPRETKELVRLNKIYDAFNEKRITPEETRHLVYSFKWKYHHKKIDMLVCFAHMLECK